MSDPLFCHYPALSAKIDRLCRVPPWRMTGASALVCTDGGLLLEVTKPRNWRVDAEGVTHVGLGAIGGSLEGGETLLDCVQREGQEELGTPLEVLCASETGFCADERNVSRLRLAPVLAHPLPCLFTIGANRYRPDEIDAPTLAIASFWARPLAPVCLGDLFGTLTLPWDAWERVVRALPLPLEALRDVPGVRLETRESLPEHTVLTPVWTVHTLQQVLAAGPLAGPSDRRHLAGSGLTTGILSTSGTPGTQSTASQSSAHVAGGPLGLLT
ncbi:MAG: NUDIX domain-containing protein [Anaerolineae bacterium]